MQKHQGVWKEGRGWGLLTGPVTACRSSCIVVLHCLPGLQPLSLAFCAACRSIVSSTRSFRMLG